MDHFKLAKHFIALVIVCVSVYAEESILIHSLTKKAFPDTIIFHRIVFQGNHDCTLLQPKLDMNVSFRV